MEFGGSWSTDSKASDFERRWKQASMREPSDFAKFGELFLNGGLWRGEQVIPKEWVNESTGPQISYNDSYYSEWFATLPGKAYYSYMWWGRNVRKARMTSRRKGTRDNTSTYRPPSGWSSCATGSTMALRLKSGIPCF